MPSLSNIEIQTSLQQLITADQAWYYSIIPKHVSDSDIEFYIDESKHDRSLANELEILFNKNILFYEIPSENIKKLLSKYYRKSEKKNQQAKLFDYKSEDFLEHLIQEAYNINCSDIHFERYEEECRIRFRIDGKLIERFVINKNEYPVLINKIKIKANLDIAEKRLPQDGRILYGSPEERFDIRVSVLPTLYGEKVVLRLLSKDSTNIELSKLGFTKKQLTDYTEGIRKPYGIVLVSGPTGSGKTTTLYATLKLLNKKETNILTIEDPIEYTLKGINQVQLKENIGLTFANALRTFLRQDPDIIMLGEIRDTETGNMAVRSSLTGHLVLSTIHTNSAWSTISRLTDMGVPTYLLASTINLAVAQRLVRLLCPHCKQAHPFDASFLPKNFTAPDKIDKHYINVGCEECFYTGYKGRKAIYEVIQMNKDLTEFIKHNETDISAYLKQNNIETLAQGAFRLLKEGVTTIDEVYPILISKESD